MTFIPSFLAISTRLLIIASQREQRRTLRWKSEQNPFMKCISGLVVSKGFYFSNEKWSSQINRWKYTEQRHDGKLFHLPDQTGKKRDGRVSDMSGNMRQKRGREGGSLSSHAVSPQSSQLARDSFPTPTDSMIKHRAEPILLLPMPRNVTDGAF